VEQALRAIANTRRRAMLELVWDGERTASDIAALSGLSKPATSQHLRVLREAGLVVVRPEAQRRVYALNPEPLAELDQWLEPYRRLWSDRLDALERHLDGGAGDPR
jgi:DNA-binding transcriptional ArsR family regulator